MSGITFEDIEPLNIKYQLSIVFKDTISFTVQKYVVIGKFSLFFFIFFVEDFNSNSFFSYEKKKPMQVLCRNYASSPYENKFNLYGKQYA